MYRSLAQGELRALAGALETGFWAALGYGNDHPVTIDDVVTAKEIHNLVRDIEHEIASRANDYNALWALAYEYAMNSGGRPDPGCLRRHHEGLSEFPSGLRI